MFALRLLAVLMGQGYGQRTDQGNVRDDEREISCASGSRRLEIGIFWVRGGNRGERLR